MIPLATYRLQFRDGMTFDRAAKIVPYLARLGVSHLYTSPIFAATAGSTHGYDITDHNQFDPALGGREGFERLSRALRDAGLGLILDLVPNHMAASLENDWWRSVVEWGQASPYGKHFDIDWNEKLTLPMLGRSYGEALAAGELAVKPDAERGCLALAYFEHRLPLDPRSYSWVLRQVEGALAAAIAARAEQASPAAENQMHDAIRALRAEGAAAQLDEQLSRLSKNPGFVDKVHSDQPWQLHFWKDARKHLSYRRFFEVTGLVGVRVEDKTVFEDVHRLALELVRSGQVDGLRIDHVDGLADPRAYLQRLRDAVGPEVFIVVEKILARGEVLPPDWPISGTTGYEFITAIADLMIDPSGAPKLDRAYDEVAGHAVDYASAEREAKITILTRNFEGELEALVRLALEIDGGDLSDEDLRAAIAETIVAFPVYRTYGDGNGMPEADIRLLGDVADKARGAGAKGEAVDLLFRILKGDVPATAGAARFRTRFQQLTGPVMAKAVEDTLFYRHNRLIGLNEVGGDPQASGSVEGFHSAMQERVRLQPQGLLTTATHDTKRGEDARARLYAISEAPRVWSAAVARWREMNSERAGRIHDRPAPDAETEWLLCQSLAGVWPEKLDPADAAALGRLRKRFLAYVEKALREAKRHTSWIDIDEPYEEAVKSYAGGLLSPDNRGFLDDFAETLRPFIRAGHLNSFTQTLTKMTAPGIPDIYQGCEMMDLSLVDPDNRRLPDFDMLTRSLHENAGSSWRDQEAGVVKQQMVALCLRLRRERPALFQRGDYTEVEVAGNRCDHIVAFMRSDGKDMAITVAPRLCFGFSGEGNLFADSGSWDDTVIYLPPRAAGRELRNVFTREMLAGSGSISVGALLADCPVALLVHSE